MTKRRGLGRGLNSLIPASETAGDEGTGLRDVPIESIRPNPHQPRSHIDESSLADLADSITEHGLIQPLVVREETPGEFTLIAGERRWRAARTAGLHQVPVVVKEATPQAMLELALIENIQRDDLNALEEALAYQQLIEEFGLTQADVAKRVGKSRPTIANMVRILNLTPEIQAAIADGRISGAHARALLPLPDQNDQMKVMEATVEYDLSVRQVEAIVSVSKLDLADTVKDAVFAGNISVEHAQSLMKLPSHDAQKEVLKIILSRDLSPTQANQLVEKRLSGKKPDPKPLQSLPPEIADLESQFRISLGTRVKIQHGANGGKVVIHYYSEEELQAIYEAIVGDN